MEHVQSSEKNIIVKYIEELPIETDEVENGLNLEYHEDEDSIIDDMTDSVTLEHSYSENYIVPDPLDDIPLVIIPNKVKKPQPKILTSDSWPTLEILPGGVIRHTGNIVDTENTSKVVNPAKLYACGRCSDSYQDMLSLVKHVKWHEIEKKIEDNFKSGDVIRRSGRNTEDVSEAANQVKMYACSRCSDSYQDIFMLVKHVRGHGKERVIKGTIEKNSHKSILLGKKFTKEKKPIEKKVPKKGRN